MTVSARHRGQPLLTLLVLLGGWIALRAVLWQSPFARAVEPAAVIAMTPRKVAREGMAQLADRRVAGTNPVGHRPSAPPLISAWAIAEVPSVAVDAPVSVESRPPDQASAAIASPADSARGAPAAAPFQPALPPQGPSGAHRWSADAWLLLRKDTTTAVTSGRGSYGQSQAGAVLRYRLAPSSAFRATIYLRASHALAGAKESEAALGFSARPIPGVPVSAAVELRATEVGGAIRARPAAYAVSELPPFRLPLGFTGEAYAQAGNVWGDYRTGFVDGQLRAERPIVHLGNTELRVGGGAWGGAQKGAARLDLGPSATLATRLGPAPLRISLDWRFRVAGNANPASGPSLTVATGF